VAAKEKIRITDAEIRFMRRTAKCASMLQKKIKNRTHIGEIPKFKTNWIEDVVRMQGNDF
jgi:hypothetical protein